MNDPIAVLLGSWATELSLGAVILRTLMSFLFAAVIGCERSSKRHAAGLRTFMLVSLGCTTAMMLDQFLDSPHYLLSAAALVGVSIITVNSVLYSSRNQIKGLTTSVGLWGSGVSGLAAGAGHYTLAVLSFFALLASLSLFPRFESYLKNRSNHFEIHLELKSAAFLRDFVTVIRELGMTIDDIESNPAYNGSGLSVYSISITVSGAELKTYKTHREIIEALRTLEYVCFIEEMN